MKRKTIYIAGKITGDQTYVEKFNSIEKTFTRHKVKNPVKFRPFLGFENWYAYMIVCLWAILFVDYVLFIWDWQESRGAKIERQWARLLGKECYEINEQGYFKQIAGGS